MVKLANCVEIITNNENCVVLKVKENRRMDLIAIGYFNGNEDMIRMTKHKDNNSYTIWSNNGKICNWNNNTLKSNDLAKIQKIIAKCIHHDLDIYMGDSIEFWDRIGSLDIKNT